LPARIFSLLLIIVSASALSGLSGRLIALTRLASVRLILATLRGLITLWLSSGRRADTLLLWLVLLVTH
jgi:hypothetical protein